MQFPERKFLALKAQSAHNTDEIPGILHRAAQVIYLYRFVLDDTSWCAFIGDLKKNISWQSELIEGNLFLCDWNAASCLEWR